jgi:hypothetical protein
MLDIEGTARTALRAAIAKMDAATQAEINATRAAVRAKQLLGDAEQTLAMLAGVDDQITSHRAHEIKTWTANGGQRPSGALPSHLVLKKAFNTEAEAKFSAAKSAHEVLSRELVTAPGHLQRQHSCSARRGCGSECRSVAADRRTSPSALDGLGVGGQAQALSAVRYSEVDGRSALIHMPATDSHDGRRSGVGFAFLITKQNE